VTEPGSHRQATVTFDGASYLLVCDCGWRPPPLRTPEAVGSAWDDHRASADG
jgi:hypothetical protein